MEGKKKENSKVTRNICRIRLVNIYLHSFNSLAFGQCFILPVGLPCKIVFELFNALGLYTILYY